MLACSVARSFTMHLLNRRPELGTGADVLSVKEVMRPLWLKRSNHLLLTRKRRSQFRSLLRRCFMPRKGWNDVPLEWVQVIRGRRPRAEQWPLAPGHS